MARTAAVTMVRDDLFFLAHWLAHYGGQLGRENCYVVNHGRGAEVAEMARGCNVIGMPGDPHPNFDMKRWRMLNHLVQGLRPYYDHVIVGDVDELVVVDPACGTDLAGFMAAAGGRRVLTPLGLEVVHLPDREPDPIRGHVIGPRRHVRPAPHYSKPCVISTGTKIARGGHFTQEKRLETPEALYLLHLKFCDRAEYGHAMDRRNAVAAAVAARPRDAAIGRHWFAAARGSDDAVFAAFAAMPQREGFDMAPLRAAMHATWRARGDTGFWEFERKDHAEIFRLPERFVGIV
ncbi:MAG: glycosyltransferase family 2 protein [Rhodobacteraceae bacterium]|nr:glycosyltransferase family 2 protein [Paracoccaceae bacterium]